jgi:hypothetical protein
MSCLADAILIEDDDGMDIDLDGHDGNYLSSDNPKSPFTSIPVNKK